MDYDTNKQLLEDLKTDHKYRPCWDCEIPYPTLSYLISTILSTLGLGGRPKWIYFWFPSQKASITSISSVSFGESSLAPPCTGNRMASFENVSPTTSRSFEIVITDLRQPGSDTNCWDCEIPYPTLSYLISTILSTLGLRGRPAWIYFWFPSQKASYY
ncbi:hypothetical protein IGI04_022663 [Brassica rapa subsp. trilocularis]|uniref:Uncharacterized protein n=1 Tax=Brassica rapa subsp. trilocularis TaxID=1813537 RepID=A0ABQ7M1L1_BRACM|nr:hypothetical protein IGI04_022663 [Brassica rapa subsp. trilocularis]